MTNKRNRRTPEQLIADLEARIEQVKRRAVQRKAKKDPTLRHIAGAVRSIDKALTETRDAATKTALAEARSALTAVLSLNGVSDKAGRDVLIPRAKAGAKAAPDGVLDCIARNPGARSEDLAAAMGTTTAGLRPVLQKLKATGTIKTTGRARATRYFVEAEEQPAATPARGRSASRARAARR